MTTRPAVQTATYTIDAAHSSVEFAVKHMMVASTRGRFTDLEGSIHLDEADPTRSSVEAVIRTASVNTGVEFRDNDLRSDNFFDAERYPEIRFRSTSVEPGKDDRWLVHGDLTIRDVTRPVTLDTELEGRGTGFQGEDRIGFTATTSIDRKEFGLNYNAVLETGGFVVGDRVRITLTIEAVHQP
ncbi:MAG TPA: YceI family protein [Dehalococcoidia bacterium]|nr:YceI family protein [Dehalococcoidia bacterium]